MKITQRRTESRPSQLNGPPPFSKDDGPRRARILQVDLMRHRGCGSTGLSSRFVVR
jgi:hypothetical protein